jgi:4-hydroxy-tetrahydrodipicolinate reductase
MKIALLGYGKMGKVIERFAIARGHQIAFKIDITNQEEKALITKDTVDCVIEFSSPHSAYENLLFCMNSGLKTVCGTTGWLDHRQEINALCLKNDATFFYASNYSIGVNLFFRLNQQLAKLMAPYQQYTPNMVEIHHTEKLDAPSGTAITLAEGIFEHTTYGKWHEGTKEKHGSIAIESLREGAVPGTHVVSYQSEVDKITIGHEAFSREGFALGAVIAAEWIQGQKGVVGMADMISE